MSSKPIVANPKARKREQLLPTSKPKDQDQVQPLDTNPKDEGIKIKVKPKAKTVETIPKQKILP